jgi:hypothetical protein
MNKLETYVKFYFSVAQAAMTNALYSIHFPFDPHPGESYRVCVWKRLRRGETVNLYTHSGLVEVFILKIIILRVS